MTEPEHFSRVLTETVKFGTRTEGLRPAVQIGKFPANTVTGIHRDGDMLVLTDELRCSTPRYGKRRSALGGDLVDAGRRRDEDGPNAQTQRRSSERVLAEGAAG